MNEQRPTQTPKNTVSTPFSSQAGLSSFRHLDVGEHARAASAIPYITPVNDAH